MLRRRGPLSGAWCSCGRARRPSMTAPPLSARWQPDARLAPKVVTEWSRTRTPFGGGTGTCWHGQRRCRTRIGRGRRHAFSSGTPSPRLLKLRLDEEPPRASPPSDPSLAHYGRAVLPSGPLIPRPAVRDSACGGEPTPGPVEQLPGGVGPGRTFTYQFASQLCWGDL